MSYVACTVYTGHPYALITQNAGWLINVLKEATGVTEILPSVSYDRATPAKSLRGVNKLCKLKSTKNSANKLCQLKSTKNSARDRVQPPLIRICSNPFHLSTHARM